MLRIADENATGDHRVHAEFVAPVVDDSFVVPFHYITLLSI
jgi:hypothetical protein